MKALRAGSFCALLSVCMGLICHPSAAQSTGVYTAPVGFVTINIAPGTGTSKRTSLISIPLMGVDASIAPTGSVSSVKSQKTLVADTSSGLGYPAGYLSQPATPFILQMTSGSAEGLMFLVSTVTPNTSSEIALTDPQDPNLDLTSAGVAAGDKFKLFPCDTLLSFFGTPSTTGIKGGSSPQDADTIVIMNAGTPSTFFYSTTLGRWAKVSLGTPDASNTPILPYYGLQYSRLPASPLAFVVTGEVPLSKRKVKLKSNGSTLLGSYWPSSVSLRSSGIQGSPGWVSSTNVQVADRLSMESSGSIVSYSHDGLNWRKISLGRPLGDDAMLNPATAVLVSKKSTNSPFVYLEQFPPYSL